MHQGAIRGIGRRCDEQKAPYHVWYWTPLGGWIHVQQQAMQLSSARKFSQDREQQLRRRQGSSVDRAGRWSTCRANECVTAQSTSQEFN
jgi:hypothetical protein